MKRLVHLALAFLAALPSLSAQEDSASLLNLARTKLGDKQTNVSLVLQDPKFLSIHPLSSFRQLIRQHASASILGITTADEPGKRIRVSGTLLTSAGQAVAGSLVYMYQTDSKGWYAADRPHVGGMEGDRGHARLFGYVLTDANGKFELETIKPTGYPNSDLPAHVHIEIFTNNEASLISELLFDDDERLQGSIRERSVREGFLISKPGSAREPFQQSFHYEIKL